MRAQFRGLALVLALPMGVWAVSQIQQPGEPTAKDLLATTPRTVDEPIVSTPATAVSWTTAVDPKPIAPSVKKGLDWLVEHQLKDGGWGQGDESQQMGGGGELKDKPNVADTCIAALALIRSGSTPASGPYKDSIARAVRFVRASVEESDSQSLAVSSVKGTRVQLKLGPNIDTFLASLLLAEVKDRMTDPADNSTVELALNKVLGKIKSHQKADGSWDNQAGWAPILAQSMAGKGINRAVQNGAAVDKVLLARAEDYAKFQFAQASRPPVAAGEVISADSGEGITTKAPVAATRDLAVAENAAPAAGPTTIFSSDMGATRRMGRGMAGGMGSAGVELYDRASSLSVLQDSVNTNATRARDLQQVVATSKDQPAVVEAKKELARFEAATVACTTAKDQIIARLDDKGFLAGFGSNGGEEFLSYMNISESLVLQGGDAWKKWDGAITANLNRIQNDDGSWSGHHCITGRNFCTSTALLVLLSDRTPVPCQAKEKPAVQ